MNYKDCGRKNGADAQTFLLTFEAIVFERQHLNWEFRKEQVNFTCNKCNVQDLRNTGLCDVGINRVATESLLSCMRRRHGNNYLLLFYKDLGEKGLNQD